MNRSTCTSSSKDSKRRHADSEIAQDLLKECYMDLDTYTFSKQAGFVETEMRKAFKQAVPLRTVVVYCYDPRAVNIPHVVAKAMPAEVYPGEIVLDEQGRKIASTTTIFPVVVAGGRAADALRSITVAQHLFGVENIVVVHHTYCGATSFTPEGLLKAFHDEQGVDISALYDRNNIAIADFDSSLKRDIRLLRESKGTPKKVNIYGYLFNIDTEALTLIVEDIPKEGETI
jgi:carbonic anhydrase